MATDFVQMSIFDLLLPQQPDPVADIGIQTSEPSHLAKEFLDFKQESARRTGICPDWQACMHKDICFTPENEEKGICFIDEPDKVPDRGPFSLCELKVLAAGFMLVRYDRDAKKIELSEADICNGWTALSQFPTYAAAERALKELTGKGYIWTGLDGKIVMSGQSGKLMAEGFEFYRVYGFHSYDTGHCIKIGSKNWSNLAKYAGRVALRAAWNKLMTEDPKALEG